MRRTDRASVLRAWVVVLLALAATGTAASPAGRTIRFERLSPAEGLSQNAINAILQDSSGFMWFGTADGLNRYDGYTFRVFKHDVDDPRSLAHDSIWCILEDRDGGLWIGTGGGLDRFEATSESFRHYPIDPASPGSDLVRAIHQTRDGLLWIGTDDGLHRLDPETGRFTPFRHDPGDPTSLGHDHIRALHEDREGYLWAGTHGGGLSRLDRRSGSFIHFRHDPADPASLADDQVSSLFEDRDGALWIGTHGGGLDRLDRLTGVFTHLQHDPGDPGSLAADRVRSVSRDQRGMLWVATDHGLNAYDEQAGRFEAYRHDPADPHSLSDDEVTAIYRDRGGVMWVGTNSGLNKWNTATGLFSLVRSDPEHAGSLSSNRVSAFQKDGEALWVGTFGGGLNGLGADGRFRHYRHDPARPGSLGDDRVMSLLLDSRGTLWVGTYDAGLARFERDDETFHHLRHRPDDPTSLSRNGVTVMHEADDGVLWVGTFDGGLNRLRRESETFTRFRHDPVDPLSLSNDRVTAMTSDAGDTLWVGTRGGGLNRFDAATGAFESVRHHEDDPASLCGNDVSSLLVTEDDSLWIGTQGRGLCRWSARDRRAGRAQFTRYGESQGLPGDHIYGMLADARGRLWLSTGNGISRFDPVTETFRNYDVTHGLQGNEFNLGASHRAADGEMFFGGVNGYNAFFPHMILDNRHVPPVVLTALYKLNQRVSLQAPLHDLRELTLDHDDRVVSFEFAALDYTAPERNRYAYKLEGFDEDWIELGTMRRATYTNLPSGRFTFRVKGSNNDGVWNEQAVAVDIRVLPPPWQTWWARTIYGACAVAVIGWVWAGYRHRQHRHLTYRRDLEQQLQQRTRELAERTDDLQRASSQLEEASLTDALTGFRNRRYLMTEIDRDIASWSDTRDPHVSNFLFLMIDLDGLKRINDTHGHTAGDEVLLQVRDLLNRVCRKSDTVVRWGGDEFLVVGRDVDLEAACGMAERLRAAIAGHRFRLGTVQEGHLSCSLGFARYPFLAHAPRKVTWDQVLSIADRALQLAKTSGRNAWVSFLGTATTPDDRLVERLDRDAREMVERGELELTTSLGDPGRPVWGWAPAAEPQESRR